jgi:predicted RNA-binding Zn-ribbon protein involved in translation (DUF1610 family)
METKFKVGDRVLCVDDSFGNPAEFCNLIKGREYIVQEVRLCPKCGSEEVNVGAIAIESGAEWVCDCGFVAGHNSYNYFYARRFVKRQEKTQYKTVRIQIEQPEPILS